MKIPEISSIRAIDELNSESGRIVRRTLVRLMLVVAILAPPPTAAQQRGPSIKLGEADLYPSLRIEYFSNDNAFLTNTDETESTGFRIAPIAEIVANRRLLELRFLYSGDFASFDESALNYNDHYLSLSTAAEITSRHRLNGSIAIDKNHEELGSNATRAIAGPDTEQVEFTTIDLTGVHIFGANNAKGNIESGLLIRNRNYLNQAELTSGFDYVRVQPSIAFTYRLSPDSRALLGLQYSVFDFSDDFDDRDDAEIYAGIRISEKRKTGGSARLGISNSNYADGSREDISVLNAEIGMFYRPVSYSELKFDFDRALNNFDGFSIAGVDAQSVRDDLRVRWDHTWSARVSSRASGVLTNVARECPNPDTTTATLSFEIGVSIRRHLAVGAIVSQATRRASDCADTPDDQLDDLDYERQKIGVFIRAQL